MQTAQTSPFDFPLPVGVPLANGSLFITLRTLDELVAFWRAHRDEYPYAAEGLRLNEAVPPPFLDDYQWVFARTKAALIATVCRWDQVQIRTTWYDWASDDPADHAAFFAGRDEARQHGLQAGTWTHEDEEDYRQRTPEAYRGWWQLENLPHGASDYDWFGLAGTEISNSCLKAEHVTLMLQEQTFDAWNGQLRDDLRIYDQRSMDSLIARELEDRAQGDDYYGSGN